MHNANWAEVDPEHRLEALLKTINDACTVSASAQKVMQLTRAGEVNLTAVVDAVMKDPQLATELLRLANSPLFGQTRRVHDIKRAVVVVGMQEVHNISAAMSMMAAFSAPNPLSSKLRDTAVLSAAVSRLLARHYGGVDESQAFLAGLLSEIGAMACTAVDGDAYREIWERTGGTPDIRAAQERERYGVRSEVIGAHVLRANHLPEAVVSAVGETESTDDLLASITVFARSVPPFIVRAANDSDVRILEEDVPRCYEELGLPPVPKRDLVRICIDAGTIAELSLRGELNLAEGDDSDDEAAEPSRFSDPAAFDINEIAHAETEARKTLAFETINAVKTSPVRFGIAHGSTTHLWIVAGIIVLVSTIAVAWLALFR